MKNLILKRRIAVLVAVCFLLLQTISVAKTTADINFAGVTARSLGLGNASVATVSNAEAIFVNPAAMAETKEWSFTSMSTTLMQTVTYQMVGATYSTDYGVIGLGYVGAETPAGYYTTNQSSVATAAEMNYADRLFILSYAKALSDVMKAPAGMGKLYVGTNLKYYSKGLSGGYTNSGSGYSTDVGILLKTNDNTRFGLTLQNTASSISWSTGTGENVESAIKMGGAHVVAVPWTSEKVLLTTDLHLGAKTTLHIGAEYKALDILAVRIGLDQAAASTSSSTTGIANNLTAGIGLNLSGISFDYAYHQDSTLANNNCHYFSLSYAPANINKKKAAEAKITHNQKLAELPEAKHAAELGKSASVDSGIVIDADLAKLMQLKK